MSRVDDMSGTNMSKQSNSLFESPTDLCIHGAPPGFWPPTKGPPISNSALFGQPQSHTGKNNQKKLSTKQEHYGSLWEYSQWLLLTFLERYCFDVVSIQSRASKNLPFLHLVFCSNLCGDQWKIQTCCHVVHEFMGTVTAMLSCCLAKLTKEVELHIVTSPYIPYPPTRQVLLPVSTTC